MSNKALNLIFECSKTQGSARVLMLAIADMSNDEGECYPGKANLARKVNVADTRHIRRLVKQCEEMGELRVIERRAKALDSDTNIYLIAAMAPAHRLAEARRVGGRGSQAPTPRGPKAPTPRGSQAPQSLSIEPSFEVAAANAGGDPLEGLTPEQLFDLAARKGKNKPAQGKPKETKPKDPKPKARNLYFDAIVAAFGLDPQGLTKSEGSLIGKTAAELKAAGYVPEDIPGIYTYCAKQKFPSFTPAVLSKHASAWRASNRNASKSAARREQAPDEGPSDAELEETRRLAAERKVK